MKRKKSKLVIDEQYMRETFGWNLKIALLNRNLTQTEFAHIIGAERAQVNRWTKGTNVPSLKLQAAICSELEIAPEFLWKDIYAL